MSHGLPDYNSPIDIASQSLANLKTDIAAQTIGNLAVDIAAQALATLGVDIKAQTLGNLAVDVAAQTLGNLGVDIKAQTVGNLAVDLVAQTLATLGVDIKAQTLGDLGVNLKANTAGNITIDVAAQTVGNIGMNVAAQGIDRLQTISKVPTGKTPVFASGTANNSTTILYTVPGGNTLYLTSANFTPTWDTYAHWGYLAVRNTGDSIVYYISRIRGAIYGGDVEIDYGGGLSVGVGFIPPYPVPAGYDVVLVSDNGAYYSAGSISGWIE